jgi:hypothetical protein
LMAVAVTSSKIPQEAVKTFADTRVFIFHIAGLLSFGLSPISAPSRASSVFFLMKP